MRRNGYFQLIHEEDGIYLKAFPPEDDGQKIDADDVMRYIELKGFTNVQPVDVGQFAKDAFNIGEAKLKVSSDADHLPENETIVVTIDREKKNAKMRMYPPSSKGKRLSLEDVYDRINQNNVTYGLIKKNIELMWLAKLYCTDVLIAKATMPVQGKNASIEYLFDYNKTSKPAQNEDGSVDFHNLDMVEKVEEGQILARLTPEVQGKDGTDVCGKPLKPANVKKLVLKHGRNIHLSEDSLEMYSDISGDVKLVDDTVFVSNLYEVPADVGPSTGDINYDGSVLIKGNVLTGYKVEATGDITVNGSVEGAILKAGGKIVLNKGVQGMGKAQLTAGGNIISNFIESANVKSEGEVMSDAIMHSTVEAKGHIKVEGKRGLIAGGKVRSTLMIEAKNVGSTMGTQTELEVGLDPTVMDRYKNIENEMEKMSNEREGLLQNIGILKKRLKKAGKLDKEKMDLLQSSLDRVKTISSQMEEMTEEYERLEEELETHVGAGKIVATGSVYPGVKLTISNVSTFIQTETKYSSFVRDGGEVRVRGV